MKKYLLILFSIFAFGQSGLIAKQNLGHKAASVNPWDGLVSLYKLDETTGTTASDSFGAAHLTNAGVTINQSGKLGTSYGNTNTNQNLSASGLTAITGDFSINVWCYQTIANNSGNNVIVENGDYSNGFGIWTDSSNNIGYVLNTNYYYSSSQLPLNTWAMVTLTWEAGVLKLYLNGVSLSIPQPTVPYTTNTATTRRMFNRTSNSEAYRGRLDNVSFFNKTLSQEQITAHYNSGNGITL